MTPNRPQLRWSVCSIFMISMQWILLIWASRLYVFMQRLVLKLLFVRVLSSLFNAPISLTRTIIVTIGLHVYSLNECNRVAQDVRLHCCAWFWSGDFIMWDAVWGRVLTFFAVECATIGMMRPCLSSWNGSTDVVGSGWVEGRFCTALRSISKLTVSHTLIVLHAQNGIHYDWSTGISL